MEKQGLDMEVAWLGPDSVSDVAFRKQKIRKFPYYVVLEEGRVIHAEEEIWFPLAEMPGKYLERNLKELASSAVSLKVKDAAAEVISSLVLRDILRSLPIPEPIDLIAEQQKLIEKLKEEVLQKEREIEELRITGY